MANIGDRLKEERLRLKYNQTDFAALAGQTKQSQVRYEAGARSPDGTYFTAIAEGGADVLYILTGKRATSRQDGPVTQIEIEDDLADIERSLLSADRGRLPGEDEDQAEERTRNVSTNRLRAILQHDASFLTPELSERVSNLLDIASDPSKLSLFRAADYAQLRKKRERMKERLSEWLEGGPYAPGDVVMNLLILLALEYGVSVKVLVELVEAIFLDINEQNPA